MKEYKTTNRETCIKWMEQCKVDVFVPEKNMVWKYVPDDQKEYVVQVHRKTCLKAMLVGTKKTGEEVHHVFWDKAKYDNTPVAYRHRTFQTKVVGEKRLITSKILKEAYRRMR